MDYIFTFEDGSKALVHHGVKGMKWGVWNSETRARYNAEGINVPLGGGGVTEEVVDNATETLEQFGKDVGLVEKTPIDHLADSLGYLGKSAESLAMAFVGEKTVKEVEKTVGDVIDKGSTAVGDVMYSIGPHMPNTYMKDGVVYQKVDNYAYGATDYPVPESEWKKHTRFQNLLNL